MGYIARLCLQMASFGGEIMMVSSLCCLSFDFMVSLWSTQTVITGGVRMAVITLWCTILTAVTIVSPTCTLLCVCIFPMALCILITMGQSVTMLIPLCEVCRSTLGPFPLGSFSVPSN